MLTLISPAKTLDFESEFNVPDPTIPSFLDKTEKLIVVLKKASTADLERKFHISKKLAELNFTRFQNFSKNFNLNNSRPAIIAFDGDVYDGIDRKNFSQQDFAFAQNKLRILSGLYGILRPLDLIQPYRLEMGVDFKKFNSSIKNLPDFWSDKIAQEINNIESKQIINLASEEYFAAVDPKKIKAKITNIIFKERKNGALKIIGINAKKARGLMVNFIIKNRIEKISDLKKFNENGYKLFFEDEENLVFVR